VPVPVPKADLGATVETAIYGRVTMTVTDLGPWEPMSVEAVVAAFRGAGFRWWISGGLALECHLGRSWRDHDDIDVGMRRCDVVELGSTVAGWDVHVAAAGRLTPWSGGEVAVQRHENNLWCRRSSEGPWLLDVTIGAGDDLHWAYRRDPRRRFAWPDAVLLTADGVPYLAPELQLMFKGKDRREKDEVDARVVIPVLDRARKGRLRELLPADHPWQRLITGPA